MFTTVFMQSIDILFHLPVWYLLFCALFAAGAAWLLYRFPIFGEEDKRWVRQLLGGLRFLFLFILSAFLLEPLIKHDTKEIEKPVVAILVDNSQSIYLQKDSANARKKLDEAVLSLEDKLNENHEVQVFLMGDGLRDGKEINLKDPATNLSRALRDLDNQFENRNLGATILFSDGLYNQGSNPVYQSLKSSSPIYTIGLGDTTRQRDIWIEEVRQNRLAYLGNHFPLQVRCKASDFKGRNTRLRVKQGDVVLFDQEVKIDEDQWSGAVDIRLKAEKAGMQRYDISLEVLDGEHSRINNFKTVYIEVIDGRNKVMIMAYAPHPDLAALKAAIESNDNYEASVQLSWNLKPVNWKEINLLILHQLPSLRYPIVDYLEQAEKNDVPVLFIVGQESNLNQIKTWGRGLYVQGNLNATNNALPVINKDFQYFQMEEKTLNALRRFPPLYSPFGTYAKVPANQVLLGQKIGNIESGDPLLAFSEGTSQKIAVLFGEGFWRWRYYDFEQNENHDASNEVITKTVQFLSAKKDKRPFKAEAIKLRFDENERLLFRAELYNASFQLVNDPDVFLKIKNKEGKEFTYQFNRDQQAYSLDAGYLEAGDYSYSATTVYNGASYHSEGLFSVSPLQLEALNTKADFNLLQQLADKHNGQFFSISQMDELANQINASEDIHSISYMRSSLEDLIRLPWIFWLLIAFISIEWFVRKYSGAY